MNLSEDDKRALIAEVTKRLTDEGRLIEAGWQSLRIMAVPDNAPALQLDEMRSAFFAGAQHLFASIMTFLEEGEEPTEKDFDRMDAVESELIAFINDYEKRHGIKIVRE